MNMCKFWVGYNTQETFVEFLLEMEDFLLDYYSNRDMFPDPDAFRKYWNQVILVFDNAGIHSGSLVQDFCVNRGWMAMTLPAYTPQYNPIELMFRAAKAKLYR